MKGATTSGRLHEMVQSLIQQTRELTRVAMIYDRELAANKVTRASKEDMQKSTAHIERQNEIIKNRVLAFIGRLVEGKQNKAAVHLRKLTGLPLMDCKQLCDLLPLLLLGMEVGRVPKSAEATAKMAATAAARAAISTTEPDPSQQEAANNGN